MIEDDLPEFNDLNGCLLKGNVSGWIEVSVNCKNFHDKHVLKIIRTR